MPGPMSIPAGGRPYVNDDGTVGVLSPLRDTHERCQERMRCTGPGCRLRTGKTAAKRRK